MNTFHLFVMAFVGGIGLVILGCITGIGLLFILVGTIMAMGSPLTMFLHPIGKAERYEVYRDLPDLRKAHKREIQKKELGFVVNELERRVNEAKEIARNIPGPVPAPHWEEY